MYDTIPVRETYATLVTRLLWTTGWNKIRQADLITSLFKIQHYIYKDIYKLHDTMPYQAVHINAPISVTEMPASQVCCGQSLAGQDPEQGIRGAAARELGQTGRKLNVIKNSADLSIVCLRFSNHGQAS